MKFDERFLDEIKGRLRLSDVIGRSVRLKRQGREYVGLSPFGKEKTPSFYVNDDKGFYHDFSSGKHGDLISFLQETERLSFREAVERLAEMAGVALPAADPRAEAAERGRQDLVEVLDLAARWFEARLRRPSGEGARAYLAGRAMPEEVWSRFRIGYAPSGRTGLKEHLAAKGVDPKTLLTAGLLIAPEDGGTPYDRFRDRIMFPITDLRGRVVSFGGRALDPAARAKYLNGPETPVFHKSGLLYGLHDARKLQHDLERRNEPAPLVVVEGYMDVIACHRSGVPAAAPMGTALTEDQMAALWRLHPEPTLCFDADGAGRRAAFRAVDRALPLLKPGRSLRFTLLSGGKDPDDVLREKGASALREELLRTKPFVEALFEQAVEAAGSLDTPERRAALKADLRRRAGSIADRDLSEAYRQDLLERYAALTAPPPRPREATYAPPRDGRPRRGAPPQAGATTAGRAAAAQLSQAMRPVAASLAQGLLLHPELIDEQMEALEVQGFGEEGLEAFARAVIEARLTHPDLDSQGLGRHLANAGLSGVLREIERSASLAQAPFILPDMPARRARAEWSRTYAGLLELAALERAIVEAKLEGDFEALQSLKARRDAQKQKITSGSVWGEDAAQV